MSAPHAALLMAASAGDPFWSDVVLLSTFDGVNGATTFVNLAPAGSTPTSQGGAALSTSNPYPGQTTSLALSGSLQHAQGTSNAVYAYGTGDFTLEGWAYIPSASAAMLFDQRANSVNGNYPGLYFAGNNINYYVASADRITGAGNPVPNAAWFHWALSRVSNNSRLFVNGTQTGSTWVDNTNYISGSAAYYIGATSFGTGYMTGSIGPTRVTRAGRYAANFTPPATFPSS